MKRLSNRSKDKSKPFDGTINNKAHEIVNVLLELLNKHVDLEGIYRIPGDMGEVRRTKEALNQGKKVSFENMNPHTQASMLKAFFKELTDPVFSAQLYPAWIAAAQHKDKKILVMRLLNMLPQQNFEIISALIIHLKLISEHSAKNLMTAENLAIVFGPILLRPLSVSPQTLLADVPWVNKCIGLLIHECSFFFKNKLLLLHRITEQTSLFEEMRKAGAAILAEERKKREKEEKRLKEEQRKSDRKNKFNTYSSKRHTVKAAGTDEAASPSKSSSSLSASGSISGPQPLIYPAPDPSSPKPENSTKTTSGAPNGRRETPPPLPPLPNNLPPPPPFNATSLRRSISAYIPAHNPPRVQGTPNPSRASTSSRVAPVSVSPRRSNRPTGIHVTAGILETHFQHEQNDSTSPQPPPSPLPRVLTEEEKQRKEDDEKLLHNMKRRYVDRRKQTLDRWFKKKHEWTEEEFNKAMAERAERIEQGEYSPQELQQWFAELGEVGEPAEDEDPLQSSSIDCLSTPSLDCHSEPHAEEAQNTTTQSTKAQATLCVS